MYKNVEHYVSSFHSFIILLYIEIYSEENLENRKLIMVRPVEFL